MTVPLLINVIVAAAFIAGVVLVILAFRGKRIGDAPHCRRCGFDLTGTRHGDSICTECGRDLNRRRSIRKGERRKRPVFLSLGVLLMLGGGAGSVIRGTGIYAVFPAAKKPTSLLMTEVLLGSTENALAAELKVRYDAKELSNAQLTRLAEHLVKLHGSMNPIVYRETAWKSLLTDAIRADLLTEELHQTYASNVLSSYSFGEEVQHYRVRASISHSILGQSPRFTRMPVAGETVFGVIYPFFVARDGVIQDIPIAEGSDGTQQIACFVSQQSGFGGVSFRTKSIASTDHDVGRWTIHGVSPGTYEYEVQYKYEMYLNAPDMTQYPIVVSRSMLGDPLATATSTVFATVDVYDEPKDVLELVGAGSGFVPPQISSASIKVEPHSAEWYRLRIEVTRDDSSGERQDEVFFSGMPALFKDGQRFASFHHPSEREWPFPTDGLLLGSKRDSNATFGHHTWNQSRIYMYVRRDELPRLNTTGIQFDPHHIKAAKNTHVHRVWNEPIIIENVPLDWSAVDAQETERETGD